jgi:hypothetical protein
MNLLKKYFYKIIALSLFLNVISIWASSEVLAQQRFPVTANTIVGRPYSIYLSDYFDATAEKLQVRLLFNDFGEPNVDVRLRITIESTGLRLQTRPDALGQPITITPGVPVTLSGADLEPYLNYNNLAISGTTAQALVANNGKLKEGVYTFCVEVLEYKSGVVISNQSCQTAWLVLNDEPMVITPICGNMIQPSDPQNIMFQWQLSNNVSPNIGVGFEYQLSLYEVTDLAVNPLYAINNGKALLHFQSGFLPQMQFLYDMNAPQLDAGKRYVYRVQARSADGRDLFKNEGFSQICWFSYGNPNDGTIALQNPKDKTIYKERDEPYFQWNNPSNASTGQQVSYRLKIVKLLDKQDPKVAVENNEAWYEENTPLAPASRGWDLILKQKPEKSTEYAWQVVAVSNNQEIAKSDVRTFKGANLIDQFNVGSHIVVVKNLTTNDLSKLSGKGELKIKENGEVTEVDFKELKIIDVAGRYVLDAGEITKDIKNNEWIELTPTQKENKSAWFVPQTLRLNKKELAVLGFVRWAFPHPTTSGKADTVRSALTSINYDAYTIKAANAFLDESNDFNLVEPLGFRMKLLKTSDFFIKDNAFTVRMNGEVYLSEKVKGYEKNNERLMIPFAQANQLFYIKVENLALQNNIHILKGTKSMLAPQTVILDFSEKDSPLKLASNKAWKGAYFEKFKVTYEQAIDNTSQFYMNDRQTFDLVLKDGDNLKSWITAQGLDFAHTHTLSDKNRIWFNQFGGRLLSFTFNIENNSISESHFKGDIKIPFVSVTDNYAFTMPLSDNGFQVGALDESLESKAFTFNAKNQEQAVDIVIRRAVFADKERLDMMIDANWKFLSVDIKGLNSFKIWGNGNIGFSKPNGTQTLTQQAKGKLSANPIVINAIAAAFQNQQYAFAIKGEIVIAEDVSGKDGAPEILLSSALKSEASAYSPAPNSTSNNSPTTNNAVTNEISTSAKISFNHIFGKKSVDDGKIILDSTFIKVNAVVAKFEGMVKMTRNHPDWGDSFQGMFFGEIFIPVAYRTNLIYVSGTKEDKGFWFIQAGVGGEAKEKTGKKTKLGGKTKKLKQGIPITPMQITGLDFRFYRHMNHSKAGTVDIDGVAEFDFIPDLQTQYGGYVRLTMADQASAGALVEFSLGAEVAIQKGGYNLGFEGEVNLVNDPFGKSSVTGTGKITYNSPKKHWTGEFGVSVKKVKGKPFCADGSVAFDISPSKWNVSLGSPKKRIKITPNCIGWGAQGWLQLDQKEFELGLGLSYTVKGESRWFDVKLFKVQPFARLEIVAGLLGKVAYNPEWSLTKMGLWAELNASIGAKYESALTSGEWKLASTKLSGNATVFFEPTPKKLTGSLKGNVEILGIATDFTLDFSTNID